MMEYMEAQMQNQLEASMADQAYHEGVKSGMAMAVLVLRAAASSHDEQAKGETNIAKAHGLMGASAVLKSWANGIEIIADNPSAWPSLEGSPA